MDKNCRSGAVCAPGRTRTCDQVLRRHLLCPLSYGRADEPWQITVDGPYDDRWLGESVHRDYPASAQGVPARRAQSQSMTETPDGPRTPQPPHTPQHPAHPAHPQQPSGTRTPAPSGAGPRHPERRDRTVRRPGPPSAAPRRRPPPRSVRRTSPARSARRATQSARRASVLRWARAAPGVRRSRRRSGRLARVARGGWSRWPR